MTTRLIDYADAGTGRHEQPIQTALDARSAPSEREPDGERLVRRIQAEFLEMPGLCPTIEQAQRLWSLEPRTCEALLNSLIDSGFLRRTAKGLFVLRTSPREAVNQPDVEVAATDTNPRAWSDPYGD